MNFDISEDAIPILELVRTFREREMDPLEQRFLEEGQLEMPVREAMEAKAREAGLWALEVPESEGGAEIDLMTIAMMYEELAQSAVPMMFGGSPEPLLHSATPAQKEKYYDPVIRGEKRSCFAFTEPDAGSDIQSMKMRAVQDGDDWILNGSKIYITDAHRADYAFVFAVTDPEKKAKGGITCFLVDVGTPGFEVASRIRTMGDDRDPYELVFTDCRVPSENVLGEVGYGFSIGDQFLGHGRVVLASMCLGLAHRSIAEAIAWVKERKAFGRTISEFQAIQWYLADSKVELEAARLLTYKAAKMIDDGLPARAEAHMAKLYAAEMAQRVTDRCLQCLGGLGYTLSSPVQSMWRHARVKRIGHGTTEIHRWMIARAMLAA